VPKLNSLRSKALGGLHEYTPVVIELEVDADASGGIAFDLPYKIKIVDIIARSTATVASATVTVSDGTNDITDALDIDTIDVRDTPSTIDTTYSTVESLTLTTASSADRGVVYVYGLRV
jgi:hypothetical protein